MNKHSKVLEASQGNLKQDAGSDKSESEVKGKNLVEDKKLEKIQSEIVRRSYIMKNTLDVVFSDLKGNLKNMSKSSPLIMLADDIAKEASCNKIREKQETFECAIGNNLRGALTVNDEAEKNNLMYLNKKVDEEEKALMEFLKLH